MKLHLGFMSGTELAEWFGITKTSYNRMRKKKLEQLKGYCNFIEKHGGIQINEIFDQNIVTYEKPTSKAKELTIKNFDTVWGKDSPNHDLDTCANVSIKLEEISDEKGTRSMGGRCLMEGRQEGVYMYGVRKRLMKMGTHIWQSLQIRNKR